MLKTAIFLNNYNVVTCYAIRFSRNSMAYNVAVIRICRYPMVDKAIIDMATE